ncbi:putative reverse transcriptase domain-containing protein [Tanacetum coccineum]
MLDSKSIKWIVAMNVEIPIQRVIWLWVLVDLPPGCKTVGSRWLFKKKTDMDGIVHVYKACLVAKGYTQLYGVDYEETFSPVADIRAIRILISIAITPCVLESLTTSINVLFILFEQVPRSPGYVPENHIPVYIPEPEHPEDLVPAEDEAPLPPLPPSFLAPRIRPLSPRALEVEMRDVASAYYHSVHPSGTPQLLPIPLPAPSSSRRADVPEADAPPRKRLLLTTPRPGCEIGESSAAAAARQPGPTIETRLLDTERRMMTALELVNRRISYQVDVCTRESSEFCTRHHDAQKDRAAVRAEIEILRRERLAYEQESIQSRQDLARSEAYSRTLEARITLLETEARRHEWQRQAADDLAVQHIMRTQALEAGARIDTLEDTGSSS